MVSFTVTGEVSELTRRDKLRMILLFENPGDNRRLPINLETSFEERTGKVVFTGEMELRLLYIFFRQKKFEQCRMTVILRYGMDTYEEVPFEVEFEQQISGITVKEAELLFSYELFYKEPRKIPGPVYRIYQILSFLCCIVLFPVFLLQAMLAYMGLFQLYPVHTRRQGVKSILKHVNFMTKRISGLSYSYREYKLHWFILFYKLAKKRPVIKNQVLFLSERKITKSGNLIRIMDEMKQHNAVKIVEYQNEQTVVQLPLKELKKIAELIATSKMIVLDDFYPQIHGIILRKETELIQLWHACGAFKTFGFTRTGKPGGPPQASINHRNYNYAFVSSDKIIPDYSEGFGVPIENIKNFGVPRTDVFFDEEYISAVKERLFEAYPILENKKVVMIAPTFRGDGNRDAHYPMERLDLDLLCEKFPEDYVFIMKHHPFVKDEVVFQEKNKNRVINLTVGEDINDLLFITDILVTDYSSVVFEAALMQIPMVFYAYDYEVYMAERDFYYDYENFVPGPIAKTMEELIQAIQIVDETDERIAIFRAYFMNGIDGNCTKRIGEFVYHQLIDGTDRK